MFMSPLICPVIVRMDEMYVSELCAVALPMYRMRYFSHRPVSHRSLSKSERMAEDGKNRTAVSAVRAFSLCLVQVPFSFCSLHVTGDCNIKHFCGI